MAGDISEIGTHYSKSVGLIYVFNLIVGTGALTMPKAFEQAGWVLSLVTIIVLSFMSFLTVTFVTEAMGIANALLKKNTQRAQSINVGDVDEEEQPLLPHNRLVNESCENVVMAIHSMRFPNQDRVILALHALMDVTESREGSCEVILQRPSGCLGINENETEPIDTNPFEISMRTELGHMAVLFFNKIGLLVFNLCIVIYLYGDLSIYAAAVPKSIRDIACTYKHPHNASNCNNTALVDGDPCWSSSTLTRMSMYRICVAGFFLLLGGFTFFNVQKTKYLQLVTTASRWIAFGMMIVLAVIRLDKKEGQGHPPYADISGVPNLFGVCVYSFMCHHSLPSLITPIKNKSKLYSLLAYDYVLILIFYLLLSLTGIYSFNELNDIYTLNFLPDPCDTSKSITNVKFIQYFLALFPVFTLSTNFPIISITLRNNLKAIGYKEDRPYTWCVDKIFFPLLALVPPLGIALGTNKVEFLVGITGSYAGAGIQYVIPAMLVFCARKQTLLLFPERNIHASPFKGKFWIIFACVWAAVCMTFVTVNHIVSGK